MKINNSITRGLAALSILIAATTMPAAVSSQNTQSPYSKFGYGLLNDNATSAQRQMGGVGYAMRSGRQINVMNPASYAAIDSLTFLFDMGVDATSYSAKEDGKSFSDFGGGLDYVTMQFPVGRRFGMSLGLLPYSSVGYSFGSKIENGSSTHEGSGGFNQLNLGFAGRVVGELTVGFNLSYLFGTNYNDVYAYGTSTSLFEQVLEVRDWHLQIGAQYSVDVTSSDRVTAGLVYTPAKDLRGHTWIQKYDVGYETVPDTLSYTSLKGVRSLPQSWGAGISYTRDNRLTAEIDFTYQEWAKAKHQTIDENFQPTEFNNRWRVGAGIQYTPNSRGNYVQKITYRFGGYYNRDYIKVNGHNVNDYGVSLGFGLPAPGTKTVINLGLEYIRRQTDVASILKENYINLTLGINFNELWFYKNKIR